MVLRSRSRENRSKVTVSANIHSENTGLATRQEPEAARPETEIAPVAGPSGGDIAAVSSRSPSVESGSEADVETLVELSIFGLTGTGIYHNPFPPPHKPHVFHDINK